MEDASAGEKKTSSMRDQWFVLQTGKKLRTHRAGFLLVERKRKSQSEIICLFQWKLCLSQGSSHLSKTFLHTANSRSMQ